MRKPYYRSDRDAWFVKVNDGRSQVWLHADEAEAYRVWQQMQVPEPPDKPNAPFDVIAEHYLLAAQKGLSEGQYDRTEKYLANFCNSPRQEACLSAQAVSR